MDTLITTFGTAIETIIKMPSVLVMCLALVAVGWVLSWIEVFPNKLIPPVFLVLGGFLMYYVLPKWAPGDVPANLVNPEFADSLRRVAVGIILGLLAWLAKVPIFAALEKWFPQLAPPKDIPPVVMLFLLPLLFTGCAGVEPGSDPVVVNAERGLAVSVEVVQSFMNIDHAHRDWFKANAPDVHAAAETLRRKFPSAHDSALALIKAYKRNRTPENKASMLTAMALVNQLSIEASAWLAKSQIKKKANYGPHPNIPAHHLGRANAPGHPGGARSGQAKGRMDARTGGTVSDGDWPALQWAGMANG